MPKCLKKIHNSKFFGFIKIPKQQCRLNCFLATSEDFSKNEGYDYEIALKLRPYGAIFGLENSSVDKYLKTSKFIRLHAAILNGAGG